MPHAVPVRHQVDSGQRGEEQHRPAPGVQGGDAARRGPAETGEVAGGGPARGEMRQDEAGDQRGGQHAAERIQAELGESGKAGKDQRAEAAHGGQDPEADRRPEAFAPGGDADTAGLDEVVDRVIDRLADQGGPEADGNAEHRAVGQTDGDDAGQRTGSDRQQAEQQQPRRTIDEQQDGDDGDRADQRQAGHVALDRLARIDRKHAGTGKLQAGVGDPGWRGGGGKFAADAGDRCLLAIGIGTERPRLDQQHRPLAVARGPDAFPAARLGAGIQPAQHFDQLAGRVARQQRLQHQPGRRRQKVDAVGDGGAQAVDREALRVDRRTQQIAMLDQEVAVDSDGAGFAVPHGNEPGHGGQPAPQVARQGGALARIATGDGEDQQAGNGAGADLIDQNLLPGAGVDGQEKGHVGDEAAVPDDDRAGRHGQQPDHEGAPRDPGHRDSIGSMVNSERSPSACRYSMLRTRPRPPLTVTRWTSAAIFGSLGSSVSVHWSEVPARCSR
jgi:hypothetical protein